MRRAVFLDRDGTLIEGEGYLGDPAGVRALAGAREALAELRRKGWLRVLVTNQSGVARRYFTDADYRAVDRAMLRQVGALDASYACFCLPDGDEPAWGHASAWRKPGAGMLLRAAEDLGVDLSASVLVGDDIRDLEAAHAAGVRPVLVRTGKGARNVDRLADAGLGNVRVLEDVTALAAELPDLSAESAA